MRERCCHVGGRASQLLPLLPLLLLAATAHAAERETAAGAVSSAVVIEWNELAYEVGYAEDELRTFKTQRAMAMMHLAMHDAVNAALGRFAPFAMEAREPGTDPTLAAAHAAHAVLADQYPAARPRLDAALAGWLEPGANGEAAKRAAELGARAAAAVLAARRGDGWDRPGTYAFATGPGTYQTMAPWDGFVLQPGFRHARPFGLRRPDQFRPGPPPALDSAEYHSALDEVRRQGGRDSAERGAEQTAYAVWWMEFAEGSVNRLARELVARRDPGLPETARLFALLDMSLYDAYVATWDAKFEYDHWRPSTAIRAAERSDLPEGAAGWEPMRPPPPFPEYVSAHAAGCASAFEVLRRVLGDAGPFAMRTATAPPGMPERRFPDFASAAAECADSRVRLGWHFRYATDAGLGLGRAVAGWVVEHHLLPRHESPGP